MAPKLHYVFGMNTMSNSEATSTATMYARRCGEKVRKYGKARGLEIFTAQYGTSADAVTGMAIAAANKYKAV